MSAARVRDASGRSIKIGDTGSEIDGRGRHVRFVRVCAVRGTEQIEVEPLHGKRQGSRLSLPSLRFLGRPS